MKRNAVLDISVALGKLRILPPFPLEQGIEEKRGVSITHTLSLIGDKKTNIKRKERKTKDRRNFLGGHITDPKATQV